jgi:hypothetical protein
LATEMLAAAAMGLKEAATVEEATVREASKK